MLSNKDKLNTIKGISFFMMILMLIAIFNLPYAYYEFLRIATMTGSGIIILNLYLLNKFENTNIFISIAILILWNPIIPFYMDKSSWIIFDLAASAYFGYLFYIIKD